MDNWQVHIEYKPGMMHHFVYLSRKYRDRIQFLTKGGEEQVETQIGERTTDDPYFMMVEDDSILYALGEAIAKKGYKAPDQHLIEGKLEATQAHLQDMRSLVFKNKQ